MQWAVAPAGARFGPHFEDRFVMSMIRWWLVAGLTVATATGFRVLPATAADDVWAARDAAVAKAVDFLSRQQTEEGAFTPQAGPAVTALVVTGLLQNGRSPDDPLVAKSLAYLKKFLQADGGIYLTDSNYKNYETSISLQAFAAANQDGRYNDLLKKGEHFVKELQWDEGEGKDPSDPTYGGAGYGKSKRPDLSNTVFFLDALKAVGNGPDDPAVKKALIFVSRCQNLETEHNTTEFAAKNPDGGFYYTPAAGGSSQAGKTDQGGLRSYASMTYAGLKSMIFAGVGPDDPRVKAAVEWIQKNYTLGSNPGMGDAGLYYYFHTFAKALDAMGQESFADAAGTAHNWRTELATELVKRQKPDGSWINENARWMEGDPNLVTGYALMTMAYLKPVK
jgi:squalene-hopene/tetraprenyl-beta-curcumene cyclase